MVMLGITRSLIASAVIVGTVALSLGSSFGISVLVWQHLLHMPLNWLVLPMAIVIMLAVGSDYNLLLVSRFQEEIHAGLKTGIIRSMGGTGGVVTTAGLVFACHHGLDAGQRPAHRRPNRFHHHARTALRHPGGAVLHDAVDRRAAGTLVLVAAARPYPRRPSAGNQQPRGCGPGRNPAASSQRDQSPRATMRLDRAFNVWDDGSGTHAGQAVTLRLRSDSNELRNYGVRGPRATQPNILCANMTHVVRLPTAPEFSSPMPSRRTPTVHRPIRSDAAQRR